MQQQLQYIREKNIKKLQSIDLLFQNSKVVKI